MRHRREKHGGEEISVEMKVIARDKAFTHFYFKKGYFKYTNVLLLNNDEIF